MKSYREELWFNTKKKREYLNITPQVTAAVKIPVIASGGAGNYEHLYQAVVTGGASAVAAGSIFHFTQQTPLEAKEYLATRGVPVRKLQMEAWNSI